MLNILAVVSKLSALCSIIKQTLRVFITYIYSHLKEEALDLTMWRARFGKGFGPVVRQTTK
jgi:hypothetical protein